jgi:hypothetical protein
MTSRWLHGLGLVLAGALLACLMASGERASSDEATALPPDVAAIPADGAAVICFRVADLLASDVVKGARPQLEKEMAEAAAQIDKHFGAPPERIERLTLLEPAFQPNSEVVLVALDRPVDQAKVKALAGEGAKEEKFKGHTLFVAEGRGPNAVALLGDRAYAVGAADPLRALLDRPAKDKDGPLAEARREMARKHALVASLNLPGLAEVAGNELPAQAEPIKPLLEATSAVLVADLGAQVQGTARLTFAGEKEAQKAEKALHAGVELARAGVAEGKKEVARQPGGEGLGKVLDQLDAALKDATVRRKGATLEAATKVDPATVAPTLVDAVRQMRKSAGRAQSANNLKQIVLAMHNYHSTYNNLPPAAIFGKDGKPLLSWRVIILPYIEQDDLYKQFHLDEPWDSDHNKKLLAQMPPVYAAPGRKGATDTHYQVFVGKGAAFEGKNGLPFASFTDGTSNTILVVEAAHAAPWTRPEDLPFDPAKPLPKLGGLFPGGFHAALADGSVRFVSDKITPQTLRSAITRNGGEVLGPDF